MSAARAFVTVALSGVMLAASPPSATSQSSSELLSDPTPFEIGYGMSFFDFDACGDMEAGRIFRRAIIEKLELCPFSPEAMEKFRDWRIDELEGLLSETFVAISRGEAQVGPPELHEGFTNPDGTLMTCKDYRNTPRYLERRSDLLRYSRGEITVDQLLGEECYSGPGAL